MDKVRNCYPSAHCAKPQITGHESDIRAASAHAALSIGWGTVLAMAVRRTALPPLAVGLAGGAAITAVVARRG